MKNRLMNDIAGKEDTFGVTAPSASRNGIGVAECLTLIKHLTAQEDLDPLEEDLFADLEIELTAELIAEEFTDEVGGLIDFETPESVALLESFAAWSKQLKGRKEVKID